MLNRFLLKDLEDVKKAEELAKDLFNTFRQWNNSSGKLPWVKIRADRKRPFYAMACMVVQKMNEIADKVEANKTK